MSRPLTGRRVIELGGIGPAPHCGMLLADLGAEVIRVDRVHLASGGSGDRAPHDLLGRGKRSLAVDLKSVKGVEIMRRLVAKADGLIEGFRPGVTERLGLGPDACLELNQRLVYGRVTGWGQEGPLSQTAGHDIDYLAVAGTLAAIGTAEDPIPPLNLVADFGGGSMYLAVGLLAGMLQAAATGKGTVVDAAMVDGVAHLSTMAHAALAEGWWQPQRQANLLDGGAPFYTTYRTADGRHMAVGALEPQFYAELIDRLDLAGAQLPGQLDRDRWPELRRAFAGVFASRTQAEWVERFAGSDACVAPVVAIDEVSAHPHIAQRRTFTTNDGVIQPSPAPRFGGEVEAVSRPPFTGQHTDEVLQLAGYEAEEVGELRAQGIVG